MNNDTINGPRFPARLSLRRDVLRIASIALAYFLAHQVAFLFPDAEKVLAAIWPAGGIGLAALLLSPRRLWPVIVAALFVAGNSANLLASRPLIASVGFMTANVLESLACAWLIARSCGDNVRFNRLKEVLALVVAATLVNACTSFIGAGTAALTSGASFWTFWITWWIADGLGILLIAPVIVSWAKFRDLWPGARWGRAVELGAFVALWCAVAWLSFRAIDIAYLIHPQPYILAALLAWPALRYGQRGVTLALAALAVISITGAAVSAGPSPLGGENPTERLLLVQAFLGITAITGFLLAASYAEAKAAEQSSRQGQTTLAGILNAVPQFIFWKDRAGVYLGCNENFAARIGIASPAQVVGKTDYDLPWSRAEADAYRADDWEVISQNRPKRHIIEPGQMADGTPMWFDTTKVPLTDTTGVSYGVLGVYENITERKQAEEALTNVKAMLEAAFEQTPMPMVLVSMPDAVLRIVNSACLEFLGILDEPTPVGQRLADFKPSYQDYDAQGNLTPLDTAPLALTLQGQRTLNQERRIVTKNGATRWALVSGNPIYNAHGDIIAAYIIFPDITERKQAEEQLKKTLAEKEALLRELYHRTKNNMQVISALLDLQSTAVDDERLQEVFTETQNRIRSMALVHQKLYEAQDLSRVNLKEYIGDLVMLLMDSYRISPGRLSFIAEMDDVLVLIDSAVPCGLILNELISNALKHAFPANRAGEIRIQLGKTASEEIYLCVADNGVGVPSGFDFKRDGHLGLQTIFALGENQLRGQITFNADNGVACRLQFKDDLYHPRV